MVKDFLGEPPLENEAPDEFCARLEELGADEIELRKSVRGAFGLSLPEAIEVCGNFPIARHRYVKRLDRARCERLPEDLRIKKIKQEFKVSSTKAKELLDKYLPDREVR